MSVACRLVRNGASRPMDGSHATSVTSRADQRDAKVPVVVRLIAGSTNLGSLQPPCIRHPRPAPERRTQHRAGRQSRRSRYRHSSTRPRAHVCYAPTQHLHTGEPEDFGQLGHAACVHLDRIGFRQQMIAQIRSTFVSRGPTTPLGSMTIHGSRTAESTFSWCRSPCSKT